VKPAKSTTARGYGWSHQQRRKGLARTVALSGAICQRSGGAINPGDLWDLDHKNDRTGYVGGEPPPLQSVRWRTPGEHRASPADQAGLVGGGRWPRLKGKLFAVANKRRIVVDEASKLIGLGVGFVVLVRGFRRGWKLARVRTQLQDVDGRLRSVDWSYANRVRTQLPGLETRLRSMDSSHANRMRTQLQDIDARLRAVDWSYANLIRTSRP